MSYPRQALGPRLLGGGLVVLLHVAMIYALLTGLAHRAVDVVRAPIETKIIEEAKEQAPEPPPPAPKLMPPPLPVFVPPPEVHVETPPPPQSTAITVVTPEKPAAPAEPTPAVVERVLPRVDPRHSQDLPYPPASRRLGEQGALILQVLVDAEGRAVESKLVQSSGFERLDQAALEGVKTNYHFLAGTVDGKPAEMWFTFRFVWKLR